jgi:hypothetical protein
MIAWKHAVLRTAMRGNEQLQQRATQPDGAEAALRGLRLVAFAAFDHLAHRFRACFGPLNQVRENDFIGGSVKAHAPNFLKLRYQELKQIKLRHFNLRMSRLPLS